MNKRVGALIFSATIIVVAVFVLIASTTDGESAAPWASVTTVSASQSAANSESTTYKTFAALQGEEVDRRYLSAMIVQHQGAVAMAQLAQREAVHRELSDFATRFISKEWSETTQMQTWQQQWGYLTTQDEQVQAPDSTETVTDFAALGPAGSVLREVKNKKQALDATSADEFDRMFIVLMVSHLQNAMDMSAVVKTSGVHLQVRDLANTIVSTQRADIVQLQQWELDWFS